MGKTYETLTSELQTWLAAQRMFFVATAPLAASGRVNCSPKGTDSFRVLGPREVAYLDLTGSGIETVAHVRENGRIVLMFCSFDAAPKIVRIHGRGRVIEQEDPRFADLAGRFPVQPSSRSFVIVDVDRIADSCGFGVPRYAFQGDRDLIQRWAEKKGLDGMEDYRRQKNAASLDGLPGLRFG